MQVRIWSLAYPFSAMMHVQRAIPGVQDPGAMGNEHHEACFSRFSALSEGGGTMGERAGEDWLPSLVVVLTGYLFQRDRKAVTTQPLLGFLQCNIKQAHLSHELH